MFDNWLRARLKTIVSRSSLTNSSILRQRTGGTPTKRRTSTESSINGGRPSPSAISMDYRFQELHMFLKSAAEQGS